MPLNPSAEEARGLAAEQFLELLCADPDWVRAEFDAIMAAEWPIPPPTGPRRGAGADQAPHRPASPVEPDGAAPARRDRMTPGSASALQRSPPGAAHCTVRSVTERW
jgi:hypothetical protein